MPVYQITTTGVDLTHEQRTRLAEGVTEIHHDETRAPEPFVRVVFTPLPTGLIFTAGEIAPSIIFSGGIRAGRTEQTRHSIMKRVHDLLIEVTGLAPDEIVIAAIDVPSSSLMEAGLVMPEPNREDEAVWMKQLDELFPGKYTQYAQV